MMMELRSQPPRVMSSRPLTPLEPAASNVPPEFRRASGCRSPPRPWSFSRSPLKSSDPHILCARWISKCVTLSGAGHSRYTDLPRDESRPPNPCPALRRRSGGPADVSDGARRNGRRGTESSPARAVEQATRILPDVIVLDLAMPAVDGWQLCHALSNDVATSGLPVLVLTGHDDVEVPAKAIKAGVRAVLVKPCPIDRFLPAIRAAAEVGMVQRHQRQIRRLYELFN